LEHSSNDLDHSGDSNAKYGIFVVYDIFGFFPQTIQGADILAYGNKDRKYQVFMPDFFEGSPADITWYPPDNEEKGQKLNAFFEGPAAPPKVVKKLESLIAELKESHPEIESWVRQINKSILLVNTADTGYRVLLDTAGAERSAFFL
jgi:hypothetical protein